MPRTGPSVKVGKTPVPTAFPYPRITNRRTNDERRTRHRATQRLFHRGRVTSERVHPRGFPTRPLYNHPLPSPSIPKPHSYVQITMKSNTRNERRRSLPPQPVLPQRNDRNRKTGTILTSVPKKNPPEPSIPLHGVTEWGESRGLGVRFGNPLSHALSRIDINGPEGGIGPLGLVFAR